MERIKRARVLTYHDERGAFASYVKADGRWMQISGRVTRYKFDGISLI